MTGQQFGKTAGIAEREQRVECIPGFYTFVRHLGKMGPPSSLLFRTVNGKVVEGHRRKDMEWGVGRRKRGKEKEKIRKETSSSSTTSAKAQRSRFSFVLLIKERKERELKEG